MPALVLAESTGNSDYASTQANNKANDDSSLAGIEAVSLDAGDSISAVSASDAADKTDNGDRLLALGEDDSSIVRLTTPTEVILTEAGILSWKGVDERTVSYTVTVTVKTSRKTSYNSAGYFHDQVHVDDGTASLDVSDQIVQTYAYGLYDGCETNVCAMIMAVSNTSGVENSLKSDQSNQIDYIRSDIVRLTTPTDVTLTDDGILTWKSIDDRAAGYTFTVTMKNIGSSRSLFSSMPHSLSEITFADGTASVDLSKRIADAYVSAGYDGIQVKVLATVHAVSRTSGIEDSLRSDASNEIDYVWENVVRLPTPTDLTLSEDGILSWKDADDRAANYSLTVSVNNSNRNIVRNEWFSAAEVTIADGIASYDISEQIAHAYVAAELDGIVAKVSATLNALSKTDGLTDSLKSDASNQIDYVRDDLSRVRRPMRMALSEAGVLTWEGFDVRAQSYALTLVWHLGSTSSSAPSTTEHVLDVKDIAVTDGTASIDVSGLLRDEHASLCADEEQELQVTVALIGKSDTDGLYDSLTSRCARDVYYNRAGLTHIDSVVLRPYRVVIAADKTANVVASLTPTNANCKVRWSSDDASLFTVDGAGRIRGVSVGDANLVAKANNASVTAPVSVYELRTNVADAGRAKVVTDQAARAILSLACEGDVDGADGSGSGDASTGIAGTDVTAADASAIASEIVEAAGRGDRFDVEESVADKGEDALAMSWADVRKAVGNKTFVCGRSVSFGLSHTSSGGETRELCQVTRFDQGLLVTLPKAEGLPAVATGKVRVFSIVRIAGTDAKAFAATRNADGSFGATVDAAGDLALAYEDVACDHPKSAHVTTVTKATLERDGAVVTTCSECGTVVSTVPVHRPVEFVLSPSAFVYDGEAKKPGVTVRDSAGKTIDAANYAVSYKNNVSAGNAEAVVTFGGNYSGTKRVAFAIGKGANPLSTKAVAREVLARNVGKKAVVVACPIKASNAAGKVTYAKAGGAAALAVNAKNGKVTVRKGTKRGTYKVRIRVRAAGNKNCKARTRTVTCKVVVKDKYSNTLTAKAVARTAKYRKLKTRDVVVARPLSVKKAKGTVTYAKVGGSKRLSVDEATGKVTVKKGTKKGSYTIKVKVTAAGNSQYEVGTKTVLCKVTVS